MLSILFSVVSLTEDCLLLTADGEHVKVSSITCELFLWFIVEALCDIN